MYSGPVRGQEEDGLGDLLRLAETLQRVHRDGLLDVLGRDSPLGLPFPGDRARGKRVNQADLRGQIPGQGGGEAADGCLRGGSKVTGTKLIALPGLIPFP